MISVVCAASILGKVNGVNKNDVFVTSAMLYSTGRRVPRYQAMVEPHGMVEPVSRKTSGVETQHNASDWGIIMGFHGKGVHDTVRTAITSGKRPVQVRVLSPGRFQKPPAPINHLPLQRLVGA